MPELTGERLDRLLANRLAVYQGFSREDLWDTIASLKRQLAEEQRTVGEIREELKDRDALIEHLKRQLAATWR